MRYARILSIGLVASVAFAWSAAAVENAYELADYCQRLERGAKGAAAHLHPTHAGSADLLGIYASDAGPLGARRRGGAPDYGRLSAGADDDAAAHSIVRTLCARASHRTPGQCGTGGVSSAARSTPVPR